ncbi:alpha/beta hydrolase [Actinoallomurus vinaceus]|uniref:Alpha/beta hydrolase n=1 Tax=Actinoallomurus vinaceus TaxID=1080074 RepID=A0ABP8USB3_9ACTN
MGSDATFVLVHGAWHGGWCWDTLGRRLRELGHTVRVIQQLPSAGPNPAELGDLRADADLLRAELDAGGGDDGVVLVGHSYGGMVISELAGHPAVRHAVYLTAAFPHEGESLFGLFGTDADWVAPGPGETLRVVEDRAVEVFYHDCEPAIAKEAAARLVYQSLASAATPSTCSGWGPIPTTYVIATEDQILTLEVQRELSRRASNIIEIASSHSPFLSMPDTLADVLTGIASST